MRGVIMKSGIVSFLSGAMLVIGVGLLVANQSKITKLMNNLTKEAASLAGKFKGKNQSCECNCNHEVNSQN